MHRRRATILMAILVTCGGLVPALADEAANQAAKDAIRRAAENVDVNDRSVTTFMTTLQGVPDFNFTNADIMELIESVDGPPLEPEDRRNLSHIRNVAKVGQWIYVRSDGQPLTMRDPSSGRTTSLYLRQGTQSQPWGVKFRLSLQGNQAVMDSISGITTPVMGRTATIHRIAMRTNRDRSTTVSVTGSARAIFRTITRTESFTIPAPPIVRNTRTRGPAVGMTSRLGG